MQLLPAWLTGVLAPWTAPALKDGWARIAADPILVLRWDKIFLESPDPLPATTLLCAYVTFATWGLGVWYDEYSWVDRIWSIVPALYVWIFALHPLFALGEGSPADLPFDRLTVMAALTTLWGIRLTYNFARKGGYAKGGEDYRWEHVKTWFSPWQWHLFNAIFIAFFQNVLLLLIACPAYLAWAHRKDTPRLTNWDFVFGCAFLLFLLMETVADQQQWAFQQRKKQALSRRPVRAAARRASLLSPTGKTRAAATEPTAPLLEGELLDGFCQSGLFRYSRHPNFFAEQAVWWAFHLMSYAPTAAAAGSIWPWRWPATYGNWTIVGAALLTGLFQGSTSLTEKLSVKRYPRYKAYQKTTSRLWPWFPGGHTD